MRPVAILQADTPTIDTIIIWDDGDRQIAYAYQAGQVQMTRTVETIQEALEGFQIPDAQLTTLPLGQTRRAVPGRRWN